MIPRPVKHNIYLGIGAILGGIITAIPLLLLFGQTESRIILIELISLQVIGMGGTALVYLKYTDNLSLEFVRMKFPSLRDIGWMFGGTLLLLIAVIVVNQLSRFANVEGSTHGTIEQVQADPSLLVVAVLLGISAGIFEEILYRGVMQRILQTNYRAIIAISVPNIIFALIHIPAYATQGININLVVSILVVFTAGMLLGAFYQRTNNLAVPIFIHALYNAIAFGSLALL